MASLKLLRTRRYYGMLRSLKIEIDEEKVVSLGFAEAKVIDLPPGTHTLVAKMDWAKSLPLSITVQNDQEKLVIADTLWFIPALFATFIPPFTVFSLSEANA